MAARFREKIIHNIKCTAILVVVVQKFAFMAQAENVLQEKNNMNNYPLVMLSSRHVHLTSYRNGNTPAKSIHDSTF